MADELVTIRTFEFLPDAEAARMRLERAGITAMLADAEAVGTSWLLGNAMGGIKLQVLRTKAEAARSALGDVGPRRGVKQSKKGKKGRNRGGDDQCLACGAALKRDQAKCAVCGWSYLDEVDEPGTEPEETSITTKPMAEEIERESAAVSVSESFHSLKRPMLIFLLLCPLILAVLFMLVVKLAGTR
jgi:hypothetical protein